MALGLQHVRVVGWPDERDKGGSELRQAGDLLSEAFGRKAVMGQREERLNAWQVGKVWLADKV